MSLGGVKKYSVVALFFLLCPLSVSAATLYLSPSSGSYALNSSLSVSVYVKSSDQAMNAVSGILNFSADKLQVVSVSKIGSIISLWVQEPAYSNEAGTVNFEGVALNPGYTGANGKIITINFRVKGGGTGSLNLSSASVLANDGQGTEILSGTSGAQFTLGEGAPVPLPVPPPVPAGKPATPQVFSSTHSDSDKWYSAKDARFAWDIPTGVIRARLLVDAKPDSVPSVVYSPAVGVKEMKDIDDGVWYFHVQLYNDLGWGGTAHFKFQIDTVAPTDLKVAEVGREDPTTPRVAFDITAADSGSGIDYYEIRVDNDKPTTWKDDGSHRFESTSLKPGAHILTVRAFDYAGNLALAALDFEVKALALPVVENYPENLRAGEPLVIIGKTYPSSQLTGYSQRGAAEPVAITVVSDQSGRFVFAPSDELRAGNYQVWFKVVKDSGAQSQPTEKFAVAVYEPAILRIGSYAVNVLAVIIPLVALVLLLVVVLWHGTHRFNRLRRALREKTTEVSLTRKAFEVLCMDLAAEINVLEHASIRRALTAAEQQVLAQLKKDLSDAKKLSGKDAGRLIIKITRPSRPVIGAALKKRPPAIKS